MIDADPLFSPQWYRVAGLRPTLVPYAGLSRHVYRGRTWHVLHDRATERHHRFPPAAYFIVGQLNGRVSVEAIWRSAVARLGADAPTQDDVIRLLVQLDAADLLARESSAELAALGLRASRTGRTRWLQALAAPFAFRVPLFSGGALFDSLMPLARFMFGPLGLILWLAAVIAGATTAGLHWRVLTDTIAERVWQPWSIAVIGAAWLLLKLIHEFWHGLALKAAGGRVNEIGVMLLLFVPLPYVDASHSTSFTSKWRRIEVAGAGVMAELFAAGIATMLAILVEPGALRSFLIAVAFVGSASTLIFNGNPLLKFDGYYILSDLIEIPNLAQRSQAYLGYLLRRYVFGSQRAPSPVSAPGERFWFLVYGPAAAIYRIVLALSIAFFVEKEYPLLGPLLAIWALLLMLVWPTFRAVLALFREQIWREGGFRAAAIGVLVAAGIGLGLFQLPAPRATMAEGVWLPPDGGQIRAEAEGVLVRFMVRPGDEVQAGAPLLELEDPTIAAEQRAVEAEIAALQARLTAVAFTDAVQAGLLREEISATRSTMERLLARRSGHIVRAPTDGTFHVEQGRDRTGAHVPRGSLLGYVTRPVNLTIIAAISQSEIGSIQDGVRRVDARDEPLAAVWPAKLVRIVPGGRNALPHRALAVEGGGAFALDPRAPGELRTLDPVFQIELAAAGEASGAMIGRRVHVRFEHAPEPLGWQAIRAVRRVLLSQFAA